MIKQMFIDTETTGVDTRTSGVYQIGGIIIAGKRGEEFEFNCDIFTEDEISPKAFEKTKITLKDISKYPPPDQIHQQFINIMDKYVDRYDKKDKFVVFAYGSEFDQRILSNWFYKLGDDYFRSWFWHPWICIMNLAMYALQGDRKELENFKLLTVAEYLHVRVKEDKLHTALYDAQLAKKVYHKLVDRIAVHDDIPF
jgi:DNA polymerase-3 subunit epsilon